MLTLAFMLVGMLMSEIQWIIYLIRIGIIVTVP